jgi:Kef-type K+ transport system membrane component KefB
MCVANLRDNEEAFFVVMLGIMAVAGTIADLINLPGIFGAFLAGLAVNAAVHDHPAKAKLEFLGKALFIPSILYVNPKRRGEAAPKGQIRFRRLRGAV